MDSGRRKRLAAFCAPVFSASFPGGRKRRGGRSHTGSINSNGARNTNKKKKKKHLHDVANIHMQCKCGVWRVLSPHSWRRVNMYPGCLLYSHGIWFGFNRCFFFFFVVLKVSYFDLCH